MTQSPHDSLLTLADAYGKYLGVTHWRVSFMVRGNGQFFNRLREGGTCTMRTAESVLLWFAAHWPEDLPWPADVPRPAVAPEAEARP